MERDDFLTDQHTPQSDAVSASPRPHVSASPRLRASASPRHRVTASILKWLLRLSRFGLAAFFLFTAGAKLAILKAFAINMSELLAASGFNDRKWMWPATIAVIVAEVITAVLLLVPRTVRIGAICAALLLSGFAGYALYYVYVLNGEPLECGCFGGIIASQLGVQTALRNLLLLIPVILVFIGYRRSLSNAAGVNHPS
ncbi:MAG TPA: MauE/DoxX family redox-associated membrane protein [Pyrinomonadaceae bacterium]|nr:MauE/DoxX family redox-associated membrane protein [Pyrinomonadaceae bacterium]